MSFRVEASQHTQLAAHYTGRVKLALFIDGTPVFSKDVRGPDNVKAFMEKAITGCRLPADEVEKAVREALKKDKFGSTIEKRL